jgi:hypothetical protein
VIGLFDQLEAFIIEVREGHATALVEVIEDSSSWLTTPASLHRLGIVSRSANAIGMPIVTRDMPARFRACTHFAARGLMSA